MSTAHSLKTFDDLKPGDRIFINEFARNCYAGMPGIFIGWKWSDHYKADVAIIEVDKGQWLYPREDLQFLPARGMR